MSVKEVFDAQVDEIYTYENQKEMLRQNIVPVCLETISPDGITLPPLASGKRVRGRPKQQRLRKRSRFANEPEKSNIVCSGCQK